MLVISEVLSEYFNLSHNAKDVWVSAGGLGVSDYTQTVGRKSLLVQAEHQVSTLPIRKYFNYIRTNFESHKVLNR